MNTNTTKPALSVVTQADVPNMPLNPNNTVQITFSTGEIVSLSVGDLSQEVLTQALLHGLKQKLVDAAAISRNTDTGRSATTWDKYNAVKNVADQLLSGSWNKVREGGAKPAGGILFQALCEMFDTKTPAQVRAFLDSKTKEEAAALRKNPRVMAIIASIQAKAAKSGTDNSDELLKGLE